ncbi:hypothetical protein pkur_cds_544 [Pandoravirus kuranda]|uniref:Uncharacterized protein n=2 Tax=Pandoravirus TaxID=2060084 RepID=A0AA95EH02_9VIRU|nr:hypothetical protein pneo_cds_580 [Pandoravirus neocaledonia]AVK76187.1 hypothetical protein pneo_cds_580 [Pandoravirus neocaledonia]WBR14718.1 hypothetical protein pkur_cds_544 [Pandoravirus kuranda]
MSLTVDTAPVVLLTPAPTAALATPSRTPWAWIAVAASVFFLVALAAAILIYERDRRRTQQTGGVDVEPLVPVGRQLAAGAYRVRWAPTGLYLGASQEGMVMLLPAAQAPAWTFTPSSTPGSVGGTLATADGLFLSASDVGSNLVAGVARPGTTLPQGAMWIPATDPSGQGAVPGTLHSAALGGCARPPDATGSAVVLSALCGVAERGWYFEPAK